MSKQKQFEAWLSRHDLTKHDTWFARRLTKNDTGGTKSHQSGLYLPKRTLFNMLPDFSWSEGRNPYIWVDLEVDSHTEEHDARVIWYNSKYFAGTNDEGRMTNFGGTRSALLDAHNEGCIVVFVFSNRDDRHKCSAWLCTSAEEESLFIGLFGEGDANWMGISESEAERNVPYVQHRMNKLIQRTIDKVVLPVSWKMDYPDPKELTEFVCGLCTKEQISSVDERLYTRLQVEFDIFEKMQSAIELPKAKNGFAELRMAVDWANTLLNMRNSRAGRSLENHMNQILVEEGFVEDRDFSVRKKIVAGGSPDFLFPGVQQYNDPNFDPSLLRVLECKSSVRERWKQILTDSPRLTMWHLLSWREKLTARIVDQRESSGVRLVVPRPVIPVELQGRLMTVEEFLEEVSKLGVPRV